MSFLERAFVIAPEAHAGPRDAAGNPCIFCPPRGPRAAAAVQRTKGLEAARAGFVVQQSATLGPAGAQKVMRPVVRNMLGRMDDRQSISVCACIRQFVA